MTELTSLQRGNERSGCVLAYGHFTTIHPGHIRYLRHARDLGSDLVVALEGDGPEDMPSRYPFRQEERAEALSLLGLVDAIVMLENDELVEAIRRIRPSVLVLGTELEGSEKLKEPLEVLKAQGGSVQFHAGDVVYANADLLNNSERDLRLRRRLIIEACRRQGLKCQDLLTSMEV